VARLGPRAGITDAGYNPMPATIPGWDRAVAGIADPGEVVPPGRHHRCRLQPDTGYNPGLGSRCSRDRWSRRGCPSGPASPMPATTRYRLQPRAGIAL